MTFARHRQDWDDLAHEDPLWAILSDPSKEHGGWVLEEFFDTGEREIEGVMRRAGELGHPASFERALDFGCGIGRLTRAIAPYFASTRGIDIADEMIWTARRLHGDVPGLEFVVNDTDDLRMFGPAEYDFVYSSIVLQHVPGARTIKRYVAEFARIVRPGGLIAFQLPAALPMRYRLQPRRRAYAVLRRVGVSAGFLRSRLGLHPIRMSAVPETEVVGVLEEAGARILAVDRAVIEPFGILSNTYWATRE